MDLFECYIAETRLATLLMDKYDSGLSVDDTFRAKELSDRIHTLIQKIRAEQDTPPDKLPVYLEGGVPA
jgi:hypothetical protein